MGTNTCDLANFEYLRTNKCLYVDKTECILNLVNSCHSVFSLSRPPHFGKTLTISTLKALFEGKKALFKGLAIYGKYDWSQTYPVIHLDFEDCKAKTPQALENYLTRKLEAVAHQHKLELRSSLLGMDFEKLIYDLHEKAPVVVLIDNFDKPVMDNLDSPASKEIINIMVHFYGVLKGSMSQLRFGLITGAIKFCLITYFSGLNNQIDISTRPEFATMLGFTQSEFEKYFQDEIEATYPQLKLTRAEFLEKFKHWYGGFRFRIRTETVYSPLAVIRFFEQKRGFQNYWSAEVSPLKIIQLAKQMDYDFFMAITDGWLTGVINSFYLESISPTSLLYRSGYLTIKSTKILYDKYHSWIGFPNMEVGETFNHYFRTCYLPDLQAHIPSSIESFRRALIARDWNAVTAEMKPFFSQYYDCVKIKDFYRCAFQAIFLCFCFTYGICPENWLDDTEQGGIDATIQLDGRTFIIKFKLHNDPTALSTIKDKPYFQKYRTITNEITLVGISLNPKKISFTQVETEDIDKRHPRSTNRLKS